MERDDTSEQGEMRKENDERTHKQRHMHTRLSTYGEEHKLATVRGGTITTITIMTRNNSACGVPRETKHKHMYASVGFRHLSSRVRVALPQNALDGHTPAQKIAREHNGAKRTPSKLLHNKNEHIRCMQN